MSCSAEVVRYCLWSLVFIHVVCWQRYGSQRCQETFRVDVHWIVYVAVKFARWQHPAVWQCEVCYT